MLGEWSELVTTFEMLVQEKSSEATFFFLPMDISNRWLWEDVVGC